MSISNFCHSTNHYHLVWLYDVVGHTEYIIYYSLYGAQLRHKNWWLELAFGPEGGRGQPTLLIGVPRSSWRPTSTMMTGWNGSKREGLRSCCPTSTVNQREWIKQGENDNSPPSITKWGRIVGSTHWAGSNLVGQDDGSGAYSWAPQLLNIIVVRRGIVS